MFHVPLCDNHPPVGMAYFVDGSETHQYLMEETRDAFMRSLCIHGQVLALMHSWVGTSNNMRNSGPRHGTRKAFKGWLELWSQPLVVGPRSWSHPPVAEPRSWSSSLMVGLHVSHHDFLKFT